MRIAWGISWNDSKKGHIFGAFMATIIALALFTATPHTIVIPDFSGPTVSVIVRETPTAADDPERSVKALGGKVGRSLDIIDGFVAEVPAANIGRLRKSQGVASLTPNSKLELFGRFNGSHLRKQEGSLFNTANTIGADELYKSGTTGLGVDVAMIDSGVVPVNGLRAPGKIVNGPDISFENGADNLRHLDSFGHGTMMGAIIAGRDDAVSGPGQFGNSTYFGGIAPDARLVSLKVADSSGATDVSQVIAAIDWVIKHRNDNGMNIRVLNLSFGTDGVQDYVLDPLTYAAEVAWHKGIVVVAAAGNKGFGTSKLNNPAYDPYIIAVGAADTRGTPETLDDKVPGWSSRGDGTRNPDLVAPGKSIISLRAPGSYIDVLYPDGRVGDRFFKGSGTSEAAAVVSGAAALMLQSRPGLSPDQVKALLITTARKVPLSTDQEQGAGLIDVQAADAAPVPAADQQWAVATGTGSIEAARGSAHVLVDGVEISGEVDVLGQPWSGQSWSEQLWSGQSWSGGSWSGQSWSGASWSGGTWLGQSWSGQSWSGQSWSGQSWSGQSWSGQSWSGQSWSGQSWSGQSWSGQSWSGQSWSSASWGVED